jgi:hypothetical protein
MKRVIATIAALALSMSLAGCGSDNESNQASAIKAACELAKAKDYDATREAFRLIAASDSGFVTALLGADYWASNKGSWHWPDLKAMPIVDDGMYVFFALCDLP